MSINLLKSEKISLFSIVRFIMVLPEVQTLSRFRVMSAEHMQQ